jgi:hypothetical protein
MKSVAVRREGAIAKYTDILAAADVPVLTTSTTFTIPRAIRLDLGNGPQVHP